MVHYKKNTETIAKTATDPNSTAQRNRSCESLLAWSRRSERGIKDKSKGLTRWRVQLQDREECEKRPSGRREQSEYGGLKQGQRDWSPKNKAELDGDIYFCFTDYAKAFDCVDHNKLWKILKEMGIPDHLTCLLRNLYAGQEATVRTGHGTTDWFQIGKGVHQGYILSPCLFNLYAEYIMQNARLDEAQTGIKITGKNINNLRYADDTILMSESEEELKSLLMRVKEERLKTQHSKN